MPSRGSDSIETPPASDFAAMRRRHQLAMEAFTPGTVTIGDDADIPAAVRSAGRSWEIVEGGRREIERVQCLIDKRLLAAEPPIGATLTWQSRAFKIAEVSGRSEFETSWLVRAIWLPGV